MKERRSSERFQLKLAGRMEILAPDQQLILEVLTKDISARGAFLHAPESFPEGTRVRLALAVESTKIRALTGVESLIKVEGKVVRSNQTGMAVCFDEGYQILGLKSL